MRILIGVVIGVAGTLVVSTVAFYVLAYKMWNDS